jgi:hypothetical protein
MTVDINTFRLSLQPIGCWRLDDPRFVFDASFLLPEAAEEFTALSRLLTILPDAPLSIFGHADPSGEDEYNKRLSGRRAEAVYGALIRDTAFWERLFETSHGKDDWGMRSVQIMLGALGFDPGPKDGIQGELTTAAIRSFQAAERLHVDGDAGPVTRKRLFERYMDFLCRGEDGKPFVIARAAFLGGGSDPKGKADFQGCGEFNPVLMFSAEENESFRAPEQREARNKENTPNRRLLIFLFRPDTKIDVTKWPCPRSSEGTIGCHKRFFSDFKKRRSFQAERREFAVTEDTFACRFYQLLAGSSPCERLRGAVPLRVRIIDHLGFAVDGRPFTLVVSDAQREATTDKEGFLSTVLPAGEQAIEGNSGESVFFGEGYEFYTHDKVREMTDISPFPFKEDPGSKDRRANGDDIEELTDALKNLFGLSDSET